MRIHTFSCRGFRNLQPLEFSPDAGMNVICGENAQGKTNLLEGLWLFTGAKSFRGAKDGELIRFGEPKAELELTFTGEEVEKTAGLTVEERRVAFLHGKKLPSPASLAGQFCAIVFSPADLSLVRDGPAVRRRFLDLAISQIYPNYPAILRAYLRALGQRNSVLRDLKYHPEIEALLDPFEDELAAQGIKILRYRTRYLERLRETLPKIYHGLSGQRETLTAEYLCSAEGENLRAALVASRRQDCHLAATSVGPHRDDLALQIDGMPARNYASQGQKRSVALALKLAEADVLRRMTGETPVALLDDVMSELDPGRQDYVLNHIRDWQVFLTCCDPSNVVRLAQGAVYEMRGGALLPGQKR